MKQKTIITFTEDFIRSNQIPPQNVYPLRKLALEAAKSGYVPSTHTFTTLHFKNTPVKAVVTCEGLLYGVSGFAEALKNVAIYLYQAKVNVQCKPDDGKDADNVSVTNTYRGQMIEKLSSERYKTKLPQITIQMCPPEGVRKRDMSYRIAYIMWEGQSFPQKYVKHLEDNADEIWVPSNHNVKIIKEAGWSKPIFRMPFGVDTTRFDPKRYTPFEYWESPIGLFKDKFVFLSIMGWSERKGVSPLVEAYLKEFKREDNTVLYLKGGWYERRRALDEVKALIKKFHPVNPPIIVVDFEIYPDEVHPRLYRSADAFVLASLGEGWGLNYTEAMAMELPTIGTKNTSMVDFMDDNNSFLVDVKRIATEPRCDWIIPDYIGMKFAIPSVKSIQKQMRDVWFIGQLGYPAKRAKVARQDMERLFSWENASKKYIKRLQEISKNL